MEPLSELAAKVKSLAASWTATSAFATFALYAVGYLSLRFHLEALGVRADLSVLDERYLYEGIHFLTFLFSVVPIGLLRLAALFLPVYLLYRLFRWVLPRRFRERLWSLAEVRLSSASTFAFAGTVVAMLAIHFFMRLCFRFQNLLLRVEPVQPRLLWKVLVGDYRELSLYFTILLGGTGLAFALLMIARNRPRQSRKSRWLTALLTLLVSIQVGLLPVNYGVFTAGSDVPRVADLGDGKPLAGQAWLVWEAKESLTFLLVEPGRRRHLLTLDKKDVSRIDIIGRDHLLRLLFPKKQRQGAPR